MPPRQYCYRSRSCTQCGEMFRPTGPRSERCQPCRISRAVRGVIAGRRADDAEQAVTPRG